jgi:hypothetical protein
VKLFSKVIATILFYPVLDYQWTLIYIECETIFLGLSCLFAYYGEYGIKAKIELFSGVGHGPGRGLIYFLSFLYILNIALRWTRVIYLLRTKNDIPENTVFTAFRNCQAITEAMDEWDCSGAEEEIDVKKFRLRTINHQLQTFLHYFQVNFPEVSRNQELMPSPCLCDYAKCLNLIFNNEELRRQNILAPFRPAEENSEKYVIGESLLYSEMIDLVILRLHTFAVFSASEIDKVEVCRGTKWRNYRDLIHKLLFTWMLLHSPRCPQQFLSRCPTFKFSEYNLLLNFDKASDLFSSSSQPILWNDSLGKCTKCESVKPAFLHSDIVAEDKA